MIIKFSRHAKRRTKLYKIPENAITRIVETANLDAEEYELIKDIPGFKFPIKIVVAVEGEVVTVVTAYPLKKERKT